MKITLLNLLAFSLLVVFLGVLYMAHGEAENKITATPDMKLFTTELTPPISDVHYYDDITFKGKDGKRWVKINLTTGKVSWNTTPDESARAFWDAVVYSYPGIKAKIIRDYEEEKSKVQKTK